MKEPGFASRQLQSCLHSDVSSKLCLLQNQQHLLNEWVNELYFMVLSDWVVAYIKYKTWIEQPEFIYSCFCVWVYILHVNVQCKSMRTCVGGLCSCVHMDMCALCTCMHARLCVQMHVLCLCMLICVYILCIRVCIGAWICMHTCICVSTRAYSCVYLNVCVYTKMCIYRCVCMWGVCAWSVTTTHVKKSIISNILADSVWLS